MKGATGALLLARRRLRRPPRGRADRHPLLRGELRAAVRGAGGEAVRGGVPGRPHAHSLHAVQQLHQVRPFSGNGRGRGRAPDRHRPLRAHPPRRSFGPLPVAARGGRFQGPDLLPVRPHPGAACPHPVSAGRADQARSPRAGPLDGPGGGRQGRQPGDLLRAQRRLRGVSARLPGGERRRPRSARAARSSPPMAGRWASTRASTISPSGSAAAWAWPPASRSM